MTSNKLPSIDIVLHEARRKLDFQFEQLDGLDMKSGIIIGVSGVVLALLVTNLLSPSNAIPNDSLLRASLISIFASLVISLVSIIIRKWKRPPNIETLRLKYIVKPTDETKLRIIDISMAAADKNKTQIDMRIRLLKCSYGILGAGLGMLAIKVGMLVLC